jgi:hypothetical protein
MSSKQLGPSCMYSWKTLREFEEFVLLFLSPVWREFITKNLFNLHAYATAIAVLLAATLKSIYIRLQRHFPTTRTTNEPGFILPRRWPGPGGSKSAAGKKML